MTTSFTVNKADLSFILRQIKIAEATSVGYTPAVAPVSILQAIMNEYGLNASDAQIAPFGLRTVDGSFNSLVPGQSKFGAADTMFPRLTDPVYRDEGDEPGGFAGVTNTNYGASSSVVDSDPRIISNLIVDMSVANPAAIETFLNNPLAVADFEAVHGFAPTEMWLTDPANAVAATRALQTIPNQSPDIGLSPGFNSWMTFFGQFFDHGLDLVTKGGNGTVYVPLQPDDPLILVGPDGVAGTGDELTNPALQFMALTRATPKTIDGVAGQENTTTSFVDQNQTYTSHSSHQVFLREYVMTAGGAVSTGKMLDGDTASGSVAGAIGNWAEVKAQALEMLGIVLTDFDVHNVPLLLTDQYGKFLPSATGYAQVVTAVDANGVPTAWVSGTAAGLALPADTVRTGHAFLNDIAHHSGPAFVDFDHDGTFDEGTDVWQVADSDTGDVDGDGDIDAGDLVADDHNTFTYDNEMLDSHFVTGDGRGNENIALTAVHSIFHSEHNRLVDANKATILAEGATDIAFLNEWLLVDVAAVPADTSALVWDGERLFQAARFATEMQYQHMVFEEFARRLQPMVDPFIFNTSPDVDPSIVAEFAHTVYRFGHSMLTGTVDRLDNNLDLLNGDMDQQTLLAVFLNPQAYLNSGADLEEINGNIIRGLSRDVGNAIDEFIVNNVRTNLLGLPLDLAVLNLSRGRETGIPSLNQTREQLYNDTGLADLKPYDSWYDFAANIKTASSVINFIAAYGTHETITGAGTLADKRAAAEAIVFGGAGAPADRLAFLNATGAYVNGRGGLDLVDLWIGGLAEKSPEFGGMLGTTFNFVFEYQMEALQNGDRLYYLTRTQGTGFLNNLEPNTFSDIVMRNTELGDNYATHLNGALFVTPDHIIELDRGIAQTDYNGGEGGNDPMWDVPNPILGPKVVRDYTGSTVADGTHDVGGYLRVQGGEHYVLGGTEGNDRIYGDSGIDTLWGDGGNDYLNGMTESDDVFGGEGDDVIEDPFGDDVLRGNQGNDVITSARGADLMFGDQGQDYITVGQDAGEVFGGSGADFILGGNGKDFLLGNEGDDWMEGGGGFDTIAGDNSELFFNSPIIGHDVIFGHGDESDYDAESGDDIMVSAPSVIRNEGMFGFDWAIAKNDNSAIKFDLFIPIFTTIPEDTLRDRFDQVEALSGWKNSDILDGDDRGHKGGGSSAPDSTPVVLFADHLLTQAGIDRIDGFNAWFGNARDTLFGNATPIPGATSLPATTYRDGNILMGGDGSDFLRGRGGYDILDGDAWLNVRIKIVHNGVTYSAESMSSDVVAAGPNAGKVYNTFADGSPDFSSVAFGGSSLTSLMLNRTLNPGEMGIVREILYDTTPDDNDDTAIFQGTLAEYDIEGRVTDGANGTGNLITQAHDVNGDGFISVRDRDTGAVGAIITGPDGEPLQLTSSRGALTDDTDLLKNIEMLRFADATIVIGGNNQLATGTVTVSDPTPYDLDGDPLTPALVTPYVGQVLTATLSGVDDADGLVFVDGKPVGLTFQWQTTETGGNAGWSTITTGDTYTVRSVDPGHILRAVAVFKDNDGATETIISAATDGATAAFRINENSPTGTVVASSIPFNPDYDPDQQPGGPTDGDIVALTHVLADDAGGRFQIVSVGGVQQVRVLSGGPDNLDFETDNEHQIVIDSYIDAASAAALDPAGRIASRQFTVLLNDVEPEPILSDAIRWTGVSPAATSLPAAGTIIANLSTLNGGGQTYSLDAGSSSLGFAVSAAGVVTRTGTAMAANSTYVVKVVSTPTSGPPLSETFTIKTGTTGINSLTGSAGDDILYGLAGNDTLDGGAGDDNLFAQAGNDSLVGGTGDDVLVGNSGNDNVSGGEGNDLIRYAIATDGVDAVDGGGDEDTMAISGSSASQTMTITYDGAVITAIGATTVTNVENVTADLLTGTDTLAYTPTSAAVVVNLAAGTASGFASIAGVETVVGTDNGDTLTGSTGANTLNGGVGNDVLTGGMGNDIVNGGLGDDLINYTAGDGTDTVNGGEGFDTLALGGTAAANTLTVTYNGTAISAVGAGSVTSVENVTATLQSNDTLAYAAASAAVVVNLETAIASGFASILGVENVSGGNGADLLTGSVNANALNGGGGNDILVATFDNVIDNFAGGGGIDTADYSAYGTALTVTSLGGLVTVGGSGLTPLTSDVLNQIENFIAGSGDDNVAGNGGANVISGNGGNDMLNGGGGSDTLTGGEGNDTIVGGGGADVAIFGGLAGTYGFNSSGTNILITDTLGTDGTDTVNTVETLRFNGVNYAVVAGTVGNNANLNGVAGAAGSQAVFGFAGTDSLNGGAGDDIVHGGDGNDTITQVSTDGRDLVDGGAGSDTYQLNGDASAESFIIYTRSEAINTGGVNGTTLNANTEIVITRNGAVIAELDNIEEIGINTLSVSINDGNGVPNGGPDSGDTIAVVGDFNAPATSLSFSTITIHGGSGNDTVDISGLASAHRLVFNSGGGNDNLIGTSRPQDVIDLSSGPSTAALMSSSVLPAPIGLSLESFRVGREAAGNLIREALFFREGDGVNDVMGSRFNGGFTSVLRDSNTQAEPLFAREQMFDFHDQLFAKGHAEVRFIDADFL